MFRSGRWRSDKNRIKVVFRLKFHATQVIDLSIFFSAKNFFVESEVFTCIALLWFCFRHNRCLDF